MNEQIAQYLFDSCSLEIKAQLASWINHLKETQAIPKYGIDLEIRIVNGSINARLPPKAISHVLKHLQKEEI
jgi:hypothetical protein